MAGPYEGLYPGTTSACAENTLIVWRARVRAWNYLRVRGEYRLVPVTPRICRELPPRARRILLARRTDRAHHGTTSACAENTFYLSTHDGFIGNYLRVRGEYL